MFSISPYREPSPRELRSFGLILAGAFSLLGLWPAVFRNEPARSWATLLALVCVGVALAAPGALRKFHRAWTAIGNALGWINSRIIFSILFYLLFTPVRVVMLVTGHDPMNRRFDRDTETYRIPRKARPGSHMKHQF